MPFAACLAGGDKRAARHSSNAHLCLLRRRRKRKPSTPVDLVMKKEMGPSAPATQPTFVLPEPLRLAMRGDRPMYQGTLQLLTGPHRVEGGWWHRVQEAGGKTTLNVVRDYWVALSPHGGVLWVFQERLAQDETAWYLHGSFA